MAKRRTVKKPVVNKRIKLEVLFSCPFCSHDQSVECFIDKKLWIAEAICSMCQAIYGTSATDLTEPIDVYHEWLDECERVKNNTDATKKT